MKITLSSQLKTVLLGAVVSLWSHTALSAPVPDYSDIKVCDVTLDTLCADAVGSGTSNNDNAAEIGGLFPPNDWTLLLKTDDTSTGSFGGIAFTLSGPADGDAPAGDDFTLSWLATPASLLAKAVDLVFAVKASPGYAGYLFEDKVLTDESGTGAGTGSSDGTWSITFRNNGSNLPDLSHISLYIRDGEDLCDGYPDCDDTPTDPPNGVPVPGTLLLLGLGLMGLRYTRKA